MKLYNTLSRQIEEFTPLNAPNVTMYACGPTVYDYAHIGHMRKYTMDDVLKRVLEANDYKVKHVMNVTDVGHLVSDADEGDDKLEKGAKARNESVWDVARFFEKNFIEDITRMNILLPEVVCRATEHISEQLKLIEKLEKNGFTYTTDEAVYFDVSKFPSYTKLSGQSLEDKTTGAREDVVVDHQKKNPADFALWFFTVGHYADHTMRWPSPWGEGFPGWHIECSAMSMEYLGNTIDIHTGGIDHIAVHHANEIAQSEAATGQQFVRFWVHHNFVRINDEKMSKSLKNYYRLADVENKQFDPFALRYLYLTAHYRDEINFTWESLQSAQNALNNLRQTVRDWQVSDNKPSTYYEKFLNAVSDDLKLPQAVAIVWEMVNSTQDSSQKAADLLAMDKVLGLDLEKYIGKSIEVPEGVQKLLDERQQARKDGNFELSDQLRHEIKKLGFEIEDSSTGTKIKEV